MPIDATATAARPNSNSPAVLVERRGRLGVLTLNRPRTLNALTHEMVRILRQSLDVWAEDDAVQAVLLVSAGERGLCAGGDVVALYRDVQSGDGRASAAFWRDEYALNARIARYPKPYVAIMRGLVLGGGVGVSAHGSHRIVTDDSQIGMPETSIGFIPDVGGTWLLSRGPGELGTHLALTGSTVSARDAIAAGLADAFVPTANLPAFLRSLENLPPDAALRRHSAPVPSPAPAPASASNTTWVDTAYAFDTVEEILGSLRKLNFPAAHAAADTIVKNSPLALTVTLASLRSARQLPTLEAALEQEFRVSHHALTTADFAEGIRARLIDKDRLPRWVPATLEEVSPALLAQFFAVLPTEELSLGTSPTP